MLGMSFTQGRPDARIVLIGYGQSNWLNHTTTASSPAAALPGTSWWDGAQWTTPPSANGIRQILNTFKTLTGSNVGLVSGGHAGVALANLLPGDGSGYYEDLAANITASGGIAHAILFNQGENDGVANTPKATYKSQLVTLHDALATLVNKTRTTLPLLISSLATGTNNIQPGYDVSFTSIQAAHVEAGSELAGVIYSHSNMDAALADGLHYTGAAYGKSGDRYAYAAAYALGVATPPVPWFISTTATIVDATHTDVALVHSRGTDFTPTSGITGFDVSNDNGSSYVTPSAAVRQSATSIRLTHASLGTTNNRIVRYQYGVNPDVSGAVFDNSSLASPLNHSDHQIVSAAGSGGFPTPWPHYNSWSDVTTATQNFVGSTVGPFASDRLIMIGVVRNGSGATISSAKISASGGDISLSVVAQQSYATGSGLFLAFLQGILPAGRSFTSAQVTHSSNPGANSSCQVWSVPTSDLSSTTAVSSGSHYDTSATVSTVTISSSAQGFILAVAGKRSVASTCVISGDDGTFVERVDYYGNPKITASDISNTAADASNNVTATFAASGDQGIMAVAYR